MTVRNHAVVLLVLFAGALVGCEAPLVLDGVQTESGKAIRRTDLFQAAASNDEVLVVVGSYGTIVTSTDAGNSWSRTNLASRPTLIGIETCPNGSFVALALEGSVWSSDDGINWAEHDLDTVERPEAITCDPAGRYWVVGSFSTMFVSDDAGQNWSTLTTDEDLILTYIQFFTSDEGVVVGEYGTVMTTTDGGANWALAEPVPDEFFPLAAYFRSPEHGWIAGLNGAILETSDGAASWTRLQTETSAPIYKLVPYGSSVYALGDFGTVLQLQQVPQSDSSVFAARNSGQNTRAYFRVALAVDDKLLLGGGGGALFLIDTASLGVSSAAAL